MPIEFGMSYHNIRWCNSINIDFPHANAWRAHERSFIPLPILCIGAL